MPSEIDYAKAGYYLEYLQSLSSELNEIASVIGVDVNWLINRLCNFSYEYNFPKANKRVNVNKDWSQLLSVYGNLLNRGIPTYPTFQVERLLLKNLANNIKIDESADEATAFFRDHITGAEREKWLKTILQAHASIDYRCNETHGHYDSEEEKIFLDELSRLLGSSIFQIIECQRPFETISGLSKDEEFCDQRIDFSLETNNTKLAIEIDGEQHLEPKQSLLDKKRDLFLQNKGWAVIRIPAWKIRANSYETEIEKIKSYFDSDPTIQLGRKIFDQSANDDNYDKVASMLVLAPIAIARIQWILNWAVLKGIIDFDKPTIRLAVIEEDIPCAYLAIWDFLKSLKHLKAISDVKSALPAIELEIISGKEFSIANTTLAKISPSAELKVHQSSFDQVDEILSKHFDLVIINSTLHIGPRTLNLKLCQNNWVAINSVFSGRGASPRFYSTAPINYNCKDKTEDLQFFLQWIFRKKHFLPGQKEIVERALSNRDVIGLLPTGAGKSLCYQLSALLEPGMTLIVDPIVSLMNDQIDNLKRLQIDAIAAISSDHNSQERTCIMDRMCNKNLLMLFISPERLQIAEFREKLTNMCQHTAVPFLVIDEAHCVSEWGHDFRPAYLRLAENTKKFCLYHDLKPTIVALTGTASWDVLTDIQREIDVNEDEAIVTPKTFDRPELNYEILKCNSNNKSSKLIAQILELPQRFDTSDNMFFNPENAGIVFCPHVNGQYGITEVASQIRKELPDMIKHVAIFGGTTPKNYSSQLWKETKLENQKSFKENRCQIMVATKAFGMGIDKPNVRFTIHYNIPTSLEAFYQEAGRAGRDRKKAICIILFSGEPSSWKKGYDVPIGELDRISQSISYSQQDDIYRMLFFHNKTWIGAENELQGIMHLVNERILPVLRNLRYDERDKIFIPFGSSQVEENSKSNEKALYRLATLGIVADYTLDYNAKQFEVEVIHRTDDFIETALLDYFSRYKPNEYRALASQKIKLAKGQSVLEKSLAVLLEFVYDEIEKKRRRAIFQMAEIAESSSQSLEPFRMQLLNYLEKSEFTQQLADVAKRIEPLEWVNIASKLEDIDSARHLLGGCRRALESYPDHPGLLMLMAFSRLMIPKLPVDQAANEFEIAAKSLTKLPGKKAEILQTILAFLEIIQQKRPSFTNDFGLIVLDNFPQRDSAREAIKHMEIESEAGMLAIRVLLESVLEKTKIVNAHILEGGINDRRERV